MKLLRYIFITFFVFNTTFINAGYCLINSIQANGNINRDLNIKVGIDSNDCIYELVKDTCTIIISLLTFVTAAGSVIYVAMEYKAHRKREKAETLAKYNERYSTDNNIQICLRYLLRLNWNINDEKKNIEETYSDLKVKQDFLNEYKIDESYFLNCKEMFLRFFEELEYSIEFGSVDEHDVEYLFGYYVIVVYRHFKEFCNDNINEWIKFECFAERMNRIRRTRIKIKK